MVMYKIVVLGLAGSGKSCLTIRYTQNHFVREYDPTIENSYRKQVEVDGEKAMLDILDTAGEEEYSVMRDQYINSGQGFVILYSVTNKHSLAEARDLRSEVVEVKGGHVPTIIVAAKCDLEKERKISREEGEALACELSCPFVETSSKEGVNVCEAFERLVREVRDHPHVRRLVPHAVTQHRLCAIVWCLMEKTRLPREIIQFVLGFVERPLFEEDVMSHAAPERRRRRRCAVQ
eukprot:TRINITY_DN3680_c0_g1_i1.p1 TRINITY_DN3680_c0_g1~~TRINITY_DN3680_c0_g1_i1.p1  ORF type:complete len:234 (-),score=57.53 TRINITY_DN3680_c0_g1_i1:48-749(-)